MRELFVLNALEEVILWCNTLNPLSAYTQMDPRIQEVMDYLCSHLREKITLAQVAAEHSLSVSSLSHLFRQQTGMTVLRYLEEQRLARARHLLELTPWTIQWIAQAVGYDNPFYFTLRFKQRNGTSPRDYRRSIKRNRVESGATGAGEGRD